MAVLVSATGDMLMLQNIRCFREAGSEGGWHLGVGGVPLCGVFLNPDELEMSSSPPSELDLCPACAAKHDRMLEG